MISNKANLIYPLAIALGIAIASTSQVIRAAGVKQPKGWGVQYIDASCIVNTTAAGSEENDPPWSIKMGYLHSHQLILMFSVLNEELDDTQFPKSTQAWFIVDKHKFKAIGISNVKKELILSVENSLNLQKRMTKAKSLGIEVKFPGEQKPLPLVHFELAHIPEAVEWLNTCVLVGVGSIP